MKIGDRIRFTRYGRIPQSGFSENYACGYLEKGISVYTDGLTVRSEFLERDIVIHGTGRVVDTGGDGEPVIDPRTIILDDKKHQVDVDSAAWCYQDYLDRCEFAHEYIDDSHYKNEIVVPADPFLGCGGDPHYFADCLAPDVQ